MDKNIFLYEVRPKKAIYIPSLKKNVRVPKSYYLTKEDVTEIIKNAHLFRRFSNPIQSVRVTTDAIDRLHNEVFMTEEEYQKYLNQKAGEGSRVVKVPEVTPEPEVVPEPETAPVNIEETTNNIVIEDSAEEVPGRKKLNLQKETTSESEEIADDTTEVVNANDIQNDIAAENQQTEKDLVESEQNDDEIKEAQTTEDQNNIGDGSEDGIAETEAVDDEDDAEDSTDYKEGNQWSEEPIRDQGNTNQHQYNRNGKKKYKR